MAQSSRSTTALAKPKAATTFLDLPAELRNQVYKLTLISSGKITSNPMTGHYRRGEPNRFTPGLLAVSRQVHLECAPVFYGGNTWYVPEEDRPTWPMRIGRNIVHLRELNLSVFGECLMGEFDIDLASVVRTLQQAHNLRDFRVFFDYCSEKQIELAWDELKKFLVPLPFIGDAYGYRYEHNIPLVLLDFDDRYNLCTIRP